MLSPSESDPHPLLPLLRTASPRRILLALVAGAVLLTGIHAIRDVATPVFAALGLAYILVPLVDFLERRLRLPRPLAVTALMLGVAVIFLGLIAMVVPLLIAQLGTLAERFPTDLARALEWFSNTFHVTIPTDAAAFLKGAREAVGQLGPGVLGRAGQWLTTFFVTGVGALGAAVSLVLIPLFTFHFLLDWDRITASAIQLLPAPTQVPIIAKMRQIDRSLSAYVRGVFIVATILAVAYSAALTAIGVPLGLLIGVLAGMGYVVPFMSGALGIGLGVTFSLLDFSGWGQVIGVLAVFLIGNLIEGLLLTPRIVGESLGLPPMAVILAVMVFGSLFGFLGVLLALPLAAIVHVIGRDLIALWRQSSFYRTGLRASESTPSVPAHPSFPAIPPDQGVT